MEVSQVRMNFCHVSLCPEQKMFSLKVKMNWVTSDCPENEGCVGILAPAPLRVVLSSLWSALERKRTVGGRHCGALCLASSNS